MKSKIKTSGIYIPTRGIKFLYRRPRSRKVICEIDVAQLRLLNEKMTVDDVYAEAEMEYAAGMTEGFTSVKKLIASLKA